jgi:hypothetical protein
MSQTLALTGTGEGTHERIRPNAVKTASLSATRSHTLAASSRCGSLIGPGGLTQPKQPPEKPGRCTGAFGAGTKEHRPTRTLCCIRI